MIPNHKQRHILGLCCWWTFGCFA